MSLRNRKLKDVTEPKVVSLAEYRRLRRNKTKRGLLIYTSDDGLRSMIKDSFNPDVFKLYFVDTKVAFDNFIKNHEIDFIFLDQRGQRWKAYNLCQQAKKEESLADVVVMILSDDQTKKDEIIKSYKLGCDELISKTDDLKRVIRAMTFHLGV